MEDSTMATSIVPFDKFRAATAFPFLCSQGTPVNVQGCKFVGDISSQTIVAMQEKENINYLVRTTVKH